MICSGRDKIETPEQVFFFYLCVLACISASLRVWACYFVPIYKKCSINFLIVFVVDECFSVFPLVWLTIGSYAHLYQFKQAEETAKKLDLDGLVVIGGDDSNTNACLLAENFRLKSVGILFSHAA